MSGEVFVVNSSNNLSCARGSVDLFISSNNFNPSSPRACICPLYVASRLCLASSNTSSTISDIFFASSGLNNSDIGESNSLGILPERIFSSSTPANPGLSAILFTCLLLACSTLPACFVAEAGSFSITSFRLFRTDLTSAVLTLPSSRCSAKLWGIPFFKSKVSTGIPNLPIHL